MSLGGCSRNCASYRAGTFSLSPFFSLPFVYVFHTCRPGRYLGVDREGVADPGSTAKLRSLLHFEWCIKVFDYDERFTSTVVCDNANRQRVLFPRLRGRP